MSKLLLIRPAYIEIVGGRVTGRVSAKRSYVKPVLHTQERKRPRPKSRFRQTQPLMPNDVRMVRFRHREHREHRSG